MQVDCAKDGPSALSQLRAAHEAGRGCDVAILDMQMPGMDGLSLAHAIKADSTLTSVRLMLLTSVRYRGHSTEAHQAGIVAYLTKPVRQAHLYDGVITMMGPATTTSAPLITRHRLAEAAVQTRFRALLAEDNIVNQQVAAGMLTAIGCRVDVAANGHEVLEALAQRPYDVVFIDCQMPEMDGYAATAAIRAREAETGGHMLIIAMTANAMQGDRERCLEVGMDDYLAKPIRRAALAETLSHWLPVQDATGGTPQEARATEDTRDGSSAHASPLDDEIVDELREVMGASLVLAIDAFVADTPPHLAALREAARGGDTTALEHLAHTLKGSSGNLGALRLADLCHDLVQQCRAGTLDDGLEQVEGIATEYARVQAALTTIRQAGAA